MRWGEARGVTLSKCLDLLGPTPTHNAYSCVWESVCMCVCVCTYIYIEASTSTLNTSTPQRTTSTPQFGFHIIYVLLSVRLYVYKSKTPWDEGLHTTNILSVLNLKDWEGGGNAETEHCVLDSPSLLFFIFLRMQVLLLYLPKRKEFSLPALPPPLSRSSLWKRLRVVYVFF